LEINGDDGKLAKNLDLNQQWILFKDPSVTGKKAKKPELEPEERGVAGFRELDTSWDTRNRYESKGLL